MSESNTGRIKGSSISRVMEIIEAVALAKAALSPADLAFMLDIPKPSIHRLLQQIQADGYLQTNMRGLVVPTARLHKIAMGVIYASRYKALRQSILRRLSSELDETCGIAMPDGIDMVYYDRVQSDWPLQLHLPEGAHVPMWCTASGKLYLSTFSKSRRQQILQNLALKRLSKNTITSAEQLELELLKIRSTEIGIDNEEFVEGMVACAVPIKDASGRLMACLYAHAPTVRKSLADLLRFQPNLQQAAAELSSLVEEPLGEE
ncbi:MULTISPECIES: IclR family transcriptional regulator [Pseudomonas]|jgi:IclR family acetate operon transcriptional repressor|uniref:HTH-type transcriptional repressor AllR n=2 Tax=Pseudomonas TaxID=286 RepID=A0A9X8EJR3_PSEPU|nr:MULTISPECIES: IclR family transcriptional regulator [Pseudomonas]KIU54383.1 IclR family transcriptional regulator [Pseudomonas putida]MCO7504389.1 IclR family transcriptional regulator [Pseudomonas sp. VE 267-6A]MCO7529599.1 IclR family transcriptional regulator [Pseudomonas sp. 2]OUM26676.1 IclR family transcriptional regulator [Pseudomonas sp. 1239]ROQ48680.1 IclR family transcriptional regulator [Pseudomonas putida]